MKNMTGASTMRETSRRLITAGLLFLTVAPSTFGQPGDGPPPDDGEGGPMPTSSSSESKVICDSSGTSARYAETLSGVGTTMERNASSLTGCPNHVNWAINPNTATENPSETIIPAYPMLLRAGIVTDLSSASGAVGIMLNGVSLFSSWAAADPAIDYESSAFYLEADTFDLCGGHSSPDGNYHYHSTPGCLQEQAHAVAATSKSAHSPQLGWSYDGFPVYGQLGPFGREMKMCGEEGADEDYCLDSCSGYEGPLLGVDEFMYRYYLSCGFGESFFPFTTNCYRGCCPAGMTCNDHVEPCGDAATVGYDVDMYTPEAHASLAEQYDAKLIRGNDTDYVGTANPVDCSLYYGSESQQVGTNTPAPSDGGMITPTLAPTVSWEGRGSNSIGYDSWGSFAPTGGPSAVHSMGPSASPTMAPGHHHMGSAAPTFTASLSPASAGATAAPLDGTDAESGKSDTNSGFGASSLRLVFTVAATGSVGAIMMITSLFDWELRGD